MDNYLISLEIKTKMINKQAQEVYQITTNIPVGKVATYKRVAQLAGIKNPRQVGYYLHRNQFEGQVPCHRVVSSSGKLAKNFAFGGAGEQRKKLEKEGIKFSQEKIDLKKYLMS